MWCGKAVILQKKKITIRLGLYKFPTYQVESKENGFLWLEQECQIRSNFSAALEVFPPWPQFSEKSMNTYCGFI